MNTQTKGLASLIALYILYGLVPLAIRNLIHVFTPLQIIYNGLLIAVVFELLYLRTKIISIKLSKSDFTILLTRSIMYYLFGAVLYVYALLSAKINNVVFIQILPFTALFGILFFKDKLTLVNFFALALSLVGFLMMSLKLPLTDLAFGKGELLSLISGLFFALALISRRFHSQKMDDAILTFWMIGIGAVIALACSLFQGEPLRLFFFSPEYIVYFIGLGFINSSTVFLANFGYSFVSGIKGNIIAALEPLTATLTAILLFHESVTFIEGFGALVILIASIFAFSKES